MRFREVVKEFDNPDKYTLFLLDLGFKPKEVAELLGVTRQHVYDVIKRMRPVLRDLGITIDNEVW